MLQFVRTTASGRRRPDLKTIRLLSVLPLLLSASACVAHYTIHPGALNKTDSAVYDALLIAEATIDQARLDYKAGLLRADAKSALDALVLSYNIARESWLRYRAATAANVTDTTDFAQLNKNLSDLMDAIRVFQGAR